MALSFRKTYFLAIAIRRFLLSWYEFQTRNLELSNALKRTALAILVLEFIYVYALDWL
jgi:hypothetical protein